MDIQSASEFKAHLDEAIKQISSALLLAERDSTEADLFVIRRSVGDIIARIDGLLSNSVYASLPQLQDLHDSKGG